MIVPCLAGASPYDPATFPSGNVAGFACMKRRRIWQIVYGMKGVSLMDTTKRSVIFPNDIREKLSDEANRRGISFNKLVLEACVEKVSPDYFRDSIEELRSDCDLSGYSREELDTIKELKLKLAGADVIRLKKLAGDARLTVTELIRRIARYGRITVNEVKIPGLDEWNEKALPLMDELSFLIERAQIVGTDDQTSDRIKSMGAELLVRLTRLRKDFYYTKRRIRRKLDKKGE